LFTFTSAKKKYQLSLHLKKKIMMSDSYMEFTKLLTTLALSVLTGINQMTNG